MRKFTLFLMSLFLMLGTTMAQNYSLTETGISSEELNAKTAPTLIAIKNLSATNNYYFVGNTGAAPYSAAEFSDAAVFVWQPVEEGVAGSYYLMKLDGTYMQATSPKDFGTVDGAAVFTTTNPTTAGTESTKFNGDQDSQAFIVDEALLVRFVNAAGTWINVQNGNNGTPTYNSGLGGWTIHHVYAVEEATVEPEPEPEPELPVSNLILDLTAEQVGTSYPYQLSDEDAAKVYALSDITIAVRFNTTSLSGRQALFATADPTKVANADAMGTNSYYVAYGMNNADLGYLASWRNADRYTAGNCIPANTEGNVAVFVINPTNNNFRSYINGLNIADRNFGAYEIASPAMVKADYPDANIYIGGAMNASGVGEVFNGQITGVKVFSGALSVEEIAAISFDAVEPEPEPEPEPETPGAKEYSLKTTLSMGTEMMDYYLTVVNSSKLGLTATAGSDNEIFYIEQPWAGMDSYNIKSKAISMYFDKNLGLAMSAPEMPAFVITYNTDGTINIKNSEYAPVIVTSTQEIKLGGGTDTPAVWTLEEIGGAQTPVVEAPVMTSIVPTEGATVESVSELVFTFDKAIGKVTDNTQRGITVKLGSETYRAYDYKATISADGMTVTCPLDAEITIAGEYTVSIPAGFFVSADGGMSEAKTYTFTVKEATVEPEPEIIPAANKSYTVVAEGHNSGAKPQWAINDEGTKFVSSGDNTISTDEQKQFAFVTFNEAKYIYSISAKKFVLKDGSLAEKTGDAVEITDLGNGKYFFRFDASHNVNIGGSKQMVIDGWSAIDGGNQFTLAEAGEFDPTEALAALNSTVEVVYVYMYNGVEVGRTTVKDEVGNAYPAVVNVPFGFTANTPEGVIEAAGEVAIECALVENYPIEYAATVDEIDTWYYMQMHCNNKKYIQYLADQAYLEWADAEVAEGEEDSYTWAFVGDPANGFKLVNRAAGIEKAVCSDGSNAPALGAFADAVVWKPAYSKETGNDAYFCLQFPGGNYMNAQNGKVAYWNDNDAGSTFQLTEREITVVEPEEPTTPALNETAVFDFANNVWGIPGYDMVNFRGTKTVETYTDGTKDVTIDPTKNKGEFYYENGYLRIAKPGSKIVLPAFDFAVEKIEVVGHASATSYPNVDMNVYVGSTAVSTACIGSTETYTYEIAADNQAAGNVYELVIGSNGGNYSSVMYITYIKVYPAKNKLEAPAFDLTSGVYVGEQTVNVHSATTDLEGVTDVTYYYTTDGNEPTVEDEETDGEITITESCTLKVIVELTYGDKVYVSASSSAEYIITEEVTYHRATSVESGSYFIVADGNMAAPIEGTSLPTVEVAVEGNDVTAPAYYAVTLEETAGGYYIKDVNGNYIYNTMMTPHKLSTGTSAPMDAWTITIADDENSTATIMCNGYALALNNGVFCTVSLDGTDVPVMPTLYGTHATGINEAVVNGEAIESIYDLQGRKIEKVTEGGIYIVNGKKILVK